ncbi:FG-GAP repeat domain-containing protein [Bythopirellula goksoeyrii]|uniref:FG-GAP repeat protein n=1 Tax=Bythopirellula goksoeyrii TaxID=1400387 RepID=A0A5B9QFA1_9BACT|nr:VCBS repeat-containing protein [Bythopirellula goksoeyrii]QEG36305.1 FG-GAP repeat protein [Bythopirellula goksoeyrii]
MLKSARFNDLFFKTSIAIVLALHSLISAAVLQGDEPDSSTKHHSTSIKLRHHFIAQDLPGDTTWGYGTPGLADFDRDGFLDYALCVRGDNIYWFEYQEPDRWVRHVLGALAFRVLGATTMDVDGDGWTDLITGGYWYRNSQNPKSIPFERYLYDDSIDETSSVHDMVSADIDGDGRQDVVMLGDGVGCFWYKIPKGAGSQGAWTRTLVTMTVLKTEANKLAGTHSGFFPRGVADLDKDGDPDIVLPDRWMENRDQGMNWTPHPLPFGKRGPYGLSCRSWITDLDGDGDQDIVMTDCDQSESRAAWLESNGSKPPSFTCHFLPTDAPGKRGSFHSLAVADFDGDNDLDIFTVEQEDPTLLPVGASPRWYVWENSGSKKPQFQERVVFDGRLGGHDALLGDVDGDGDLDICSKVWSRWPNSSNGGVEHVEFLENLAK